tara:strand:+ start:1471 stop:1899 length:429 start_codon:yes stop_codon:yes gene_type:complete
VFFLQRSSSVQVSPVSGNSVTITGATIPQGEDPDIVISPLWAFSGSDIFLGGAGDVTVNGNFAIAQRFSSLFTNGNVNFNLNTIIIQQNAVMDLLSAGTTNFIKMPFVLIRLGGGVRNLTGVELTSVSCDDSAWTNGLIACP